MKPNVTTYAIATIWLFHISAIIGMSLGYFDFFLPKTPLNLLISFSLLLFLSPLNWKKATIIFLFFTTGMLAEWIGVKYGFLFGEYRYGNNLGIKLDGVPLLIGLNWAMLTLITGAISTKLVKSTWSRVVIGSLLMVFLDLFIESSAPLFDFWHWEADIVPFRNYMAWFGISAFLHIVYQSHIKEFNFIFSAHLYALQLLFFAVFYEF